MSNVSLQTTRKIQGVITLWVFVSAWKVEMAGKWQATERWFVLNSFFSLYRLWMVISTSHIKPKSSLPLVGLPFQMLPFWHCYLNWLSSTPRVRIPLCSCSLCSWTPLLPAIAPAPFIFNIRNEPAHRVLLPTRWTELLAPLCVPDPTIGLIMAYCNYYF